ncbi:MAG TPA: mechanosensitive ion channel family protein [Candidatus Thermoplasmatota archaeon]|jgi:small-conductance mechanosensitive channel|nr:mechanosensitive ion channel family protein [Candidatus Thermoplasmatota archaeon]
MAPPAIPSAPATALAQTWLGLLPQGPAGAALFFVLWTVASVAAVVVFRRVLYVRAKKSANRVDDILADALRGPMVLWLLLAGLWVEARVFAAFPDAWMPAIGVAIPVLFALTVAYTLVRIGVGIMDQYAASRPSFRAVQGTLEFGMRLVVYAVALMLVLDYLGVTITPILGALGIAGLAVALALQDTLSNFFAGLYLSLDRPLREGDYVELDGGAFGTIKGHVADVGWRSLRIRELTDNTFIVPNSKVAGGIIKNYDLPSPEMAALVQVTVAHGNDLDHVERVTVEAAREAMRHVPGAAQGFEPRLRYQAFADNGIAFTVVLRVQRFVDQSPLVHEFLKLLHERYRAEGIEIRLPASPPPAPAPGPKPANEPRMPPASGRP